MDVRAIHNYMQHPGMLNTQTCSQLDELCRKYPYAASLQLLYTKNLQLTNDVLFKEQLQKAAAYSNNRNTLFYLMEILPSSIEAAEEKEKVTTDSTNKGKETQTANTESPVEHRVSDIEKEIQREHSTENENIVVNNKENETNTDIHKPEEKVEAALEKQYLEAAIGGSLYYDLLEEEHALITAGENAELKNNTAITEKTDEDVSKINKLSFTSWLNFIETNTIASEKDTTPTPSSSKEISFQKPSYTPFFSPAQMAKKSVEENDDFITETLANLYYKQGNYTKALDAYKKLSLKFPEKKRYFAAQIKIIKEKIN